MLHGLEYVTCNMGRWKMETGKSGRVLQCKYLYMETTSVDRLGGDVIDLVRAMWETLWFE